MNKIIVIFFVLMLAVNPLHAQYYYKDILTNKELLTTMQRYKENKIKNVSIESFEADGLPSEGFICSRKISKDYKTVTLFTRSNMVAPSLFISRFNEDGTLSSTYDSSDISVTAIQYTYDDKKRIHSILSRIHSTDDDFTNEIKEEHLYLYENKSVPAKMIRIRNLTDSTLILFANDENGNIGIEKDTRSGTKYYYYYDNKQRLTSVVQENDFKIRPVPDYIFQYNNQDNITQMIVTAEGGNNYVTWKYGYEDGLRIWEKCYGKDKRLVGSIEYHYK
ncbi:MAG: hypothetical protein J0H76_04005 [Sphingobacteriales bacterium]|nr:hypothetical protein [Sphingobacteriales bacterium]